MNPSTLSQEIEKRKSLIKEDRVKGWDTAFVRDISNLKGFLEGCLFELKNEERDYKEHKNVSDAEGWELAIDDNAEEGFRTIEASETFEQILNQITADIKLCEKELGELK